MAQERSDRSVVLVTPIAPSVTGNGLAMRAGMFLDALAAVGDVDLVVIPVAGPATTTAWAETRARRIAVVAPLDRDGARAHGIAQLADPDLRARLEMTAPVPNRAASAPPTLAAIAVEALGSRGAPPAAVVALREYLLPLGITLARRLDAPRTVVDLDDDVEHLYAEQGDTDSAPAYHRLHRAWLGDATVVTLASRLDAARVADRYDHDHVVAVPNAIAPVPAPSPLPRHDRVLFVGNLTYAPNIDAARFLVNDVWRRVLEHRPHATLELVGPADERLAALHTAPRVTLTGYVDDLASRYADADVVVAPLLLGSGTRIKVLEAFAHCRPLVATPAAVAGIDVRDGVDTLLADSAAAFGDAVARVLTDRALADRLAAAGSATLARRYTPDAVAPLIRSVVLGDREAPREAGAP